MLRYPRTGSYGNSEVQEEIRGSGDRGFVKKSK